MTTPEPFLRWAGGKRQLLSTIIPALPADFDFNKNRFFEPFVGGGAVMFSLASHQTAVQLGAPRRKRNLPLVINDVNEDLVATYRTIRENVDDLVSELRIEAKAITAADYYKMRDRAVSTDLERAVRMIYLNRLSFNGLYRVNSAGKFNVPYANLANPTVLDEARLRACSMWLKQVEIRNGSYVAAVTDAKAGDVVYLDPPYIPLTPTASFSKYAKDDFKEYDQWALAGTIRGLIANGVRVMFSNSNTELTRTIFGKDLTLYAISASRSISASAASRGSVEEVLGISYSPAKAADPAVLRALRKA